MKSLWDSAIGLLVVTGGLLGLTLPFGKLAGEAGIAPALWALVISLGAGSVLLIWTVARGQRVGLDAGRLRYFAIAAAISYAIPNLLMFSAIPHLGAGYTGIMFTLSPVITLMLSVLFRVRKPTALGMAGIAVGFVGALVVAWTRGEAGRPADLSGSSSACSFQSALRQATSTARSIGRKTGERPSSPSAATLRPLPCSF